MYTHGGGGKLGEGAAVSPRQETLCSQTGGRPLCFFGESIDNSSADSELEVDTTVIMVKYYLDITE